MDMLNTFTPYDFNYYYDEQSKYSEYNEIIDEAIDKIKTGILNEAKTAVEDQLKKADKIQLELDEETSLNAELKDKINEYEKKIEKLYVTIDKYKNAPNATKYHVGDKVYISKYKGQKNLVCPTCQGKGKIKVNTDQYGEAEIICPDCKNMENLYSVKSKYNFQNAKYCKRINYSEYMVSGPYTIMGVDVYSEATSMKSSSGMPTGEYDFNNLMVETVYNLKENDDTFTDNELYSSLIEACNVVENKNKEEYEDALNRMGISTEETNRN